MARSCYRRKTRNDNDATFIITILLASGLWAHKTGLLQAEHLAKYVLLIVPGVVVIFIIARLVKRIKASSWRSNPDMMTIDAMTGLEFERYVAQLLLLQGYGAVRLTEKYDYGIDIIAIKDGITWGIQVKRYSGLVKADAVRQVVTALKKYHCDRAMVITNSIYSNVAKELARTNGCILIDRARLMRMERMK
jgi:restriction system protein